ncbi:MAG: hypothetical protein KF760_24595 [Candidatus Eremiobacteraeota bacterium]|nr:hypothetical protein [Candidatus Eremiobacteraeota bacterium]MCW5871282.1 hypothetical protein [Candidatus Eremiobacteraeota bacterium]
MENDMEENEKPSLGLVLLKVLGMAGLLVLLLVGAAFWWLSSLSDVPPR